jgi:hypothetical protein
MRAGLLGLAGLFVLLAGLLDLSDRARVNPLVVPAEAAAQEIAQSTTAVYVSLRIINSALSTAQEIELGASVGAQVGVQPLKVLEPVDDTVERVASVVFAVAAGAAVVWVGLAPVAGLGLVLLGAGLLLGWLAGLRPSAAPLEAAAARSMRLGLALGVVLPLVFALGVALGDWLTQARFVGALATLDAVTDEAARLVGAGDAGEIADDLAGTPEAGRLQALWSRLSAAGEAMGGAAEAAQSYIDAVGVFLSRAEDLFTASLTLIAVFALRMLVLPALLLWAGMTLLRQSVTRSP